MRGHQLLHSLEDTYACIVHAPGDRRHGGDPGRAAQQSAPRPAKPAAAAKSAKPAARRRRIVNLNTATQAQLETLPGIGAKAAERILEYRQKNGQFKKIEDLMNVKGIGEKSFLKLKPLLTVTREGRPLGGSGPLGVAFRLRQDPTSMARRLRGLTPGFTILELLFVLAIAGTLTTIAVPQGLRALDDFRTRSAARYLAQRLGDARLGAIKRSIAHGLRFETGHARLPHHDAWSTATPTVCAPRTSSSGVDRTLTEPETARPRISRTSRSASWTACRMPTGSRPTAPTACASARRSCSP